jgi:hypothetical protein
MQTLLQDVAEYWPMAGGLAPTLRRDLQQQLVPLLPVLIGIAVAFLVVSSAIFLKLIATATFIPFFIILFSPFLMLLPNRKGDPGAANFELGKFIKVSWQGGLAFGFLVAGVFLLVFIHWVKA